MNRAFLVLFFLLFLTKHAFSDTQSDQRSAAYEQARADYQAYLRQLKTLSHEYKEITGEMKKILKEEGVPQWDADSGSLEIIPLGSDSADIRQTEKEMFISVGLPGLQKDSIRVSIQDGKILKITALRKKPTGAGETHELTPQVEKQIELPSPAEEKGAKAGYEDGVLTVTLLKSSQPKKEVPVPLD